MPYHRSTCAETRSERLKRVYTTMTTFLSLTVEIDVLAVLNMAEHVDLAVASGVMSEREGEGMIWEELERFVSVSA